MTKMEAFCEIFRRLRLKRGMTLRQFCQEYGFDAGNISKLERGRLPPPQSRDKLAEYASALGLMPGSDDWYEFFDQAALSRGRIPPAVLDDAEVLARLPLVFRTLRGERVTAEQLEQLIELIRRE